MRSGAVENEISPSAAKLSIRVSEYFVSPAVRASRSYSTPVWRKPAQANIPRR